MFVYTIQPVVKPVWQPVVSCIQTFSRLSNPFDKRLYRVYSRLSNRVVQPVWQPCSTNSLFVQHGCQTMFVKPVVQPGLTTGWTHSAVRSTRSFDNRLYRVYEHSTGCQTGLATSWMFVYTIQPVVRPVVQPIWQPVVSCKRGLSITFLWWWRIKQNTWLWTCSHFCTCFWCVSYWNVDPE